MLKIGINHLHGLLQLTIFRSQFILLNQVQDYNKIVAWSILITISRVNGILLKQGIIIP